MKTTGKKNHSEYLELAHLEVDGEIAAAELHQLDDHSVSCPECRGARRETTSLANVLAESRIQADPDLARRVIENLPPAAWEMRRPASWRFAAIAVVILLAAAYGLTLQSEPLGEALPLLGALAAIAELFRSAALAGAGLLAASWSGLGLALGEILSQSRFGLAAFGLFVVGLDLLLLRYLMRASRREASLHRRSDDST